MKIFLTPELLKKEAVIFSRCLQKRQIKELYGITDGKRIGTYIERSFIDYLYEKYDFRTSSSSRGIDFPDLLIDIKTTSFIQPQSSAPFKNLQQKIYGLGYGLIVFVYKKIDDYNTKTTRFEIKNNIVVGKDRTGDYRTTKEILRCINTARSDASKAVANFLFTNELVSTYEESLSLAKKLISNPPVQGKLTITNAFQYRLQYDKVGKK